MSLPPLPRDYRDMLDCMLRHRVEFLLVGGWAVAVHGHQRAAGRTQDLADAEALQALPDKPHA